MPRILLITTTPPHPPVVGGFQRTNLLHRALRMIGDVDLYLCADPATIGRRAMDTLVAEFGLVACSPLSQRGELGFWRGLRRVSARHVDALAYVLGGIRPLYRPDPRLSFALLSAVRRCAYDIVVVQTIELAGRCGALEHDRLVLDVNDLDVDVYRGLLVPDRLNRLKAIIVRRYLSELQTIVPTVASRCSAIWVTKDADRAAPGLTGAEILPNVPFDVPDTTAPAVGSSTIVVVGTLSHAPHVLGLDRFLAEVWPLVRQDVPGAQLRIIGARLSPADRHRWATIPGVLVVGFVPHLAESYAECAFAIVPCFTGGGTNIKVLEALTYGRTCVCTPHATRGYEEALFHEDALLVADTTGDFARACVRLLRSPETCRRLALRGNIVVRDRFCYARFRAVVSRTIERVLGSPPPPRGSVSSHN
jgi:hypothetical protein